MFPLKTTVPTPHQPRVTWGLVAVNGLIFLMQAGLDESELAAFIDRFALIPARYFGGGSAGSGPAIFVPLITHFFLHGSG